MPQACCCNRRREIAAGRPGLRNEDADTFVDLCHGGGRESKRAPRVSVELVDFRGEDIVLQAGTIDVRSAPYYCGRRWYAHHGTGSGVLEMLSGGADHQALWCSVIVQVKRLAEKRGTLPLKAVKICILVHLVVVGTLTSGRPTRPYSPRPPRAADAVGTFRDADAARSSHGARRRNSTWRDCNPRLRNRTGIANVAAEEGVLDEVFVFTNEQGYGWAPAPAVMLARARTHAGDRRPAYQFYLRRRGGRSSPSSSPKVDASGNVMLAASANRIIGRAASSTSARTRTRHLQRHVQRLELLWAWPGRKTGIVGDGDAKLVEKLRSPTAAALRQRAAPARAHVTERAASARRNGVELIEIAPGIHVERDVVARLGVFRPHPPETLVTMDWLAVQRGSSACRRSGAATAPAPCADRPARLRRGGRPTSKERHAGPRAAGLRRLARPVVRHHRRPDRPGGSPQTLNRDRSPQELNAVMILVTLSQTSLDTLWDLMVIGQRRQRPRSWKPESCALIDDVPPTARTVAPRTRRGANRTAGPATCSTGAA